MNTIKSILYDELRPFLADQKDEDYYTPEFRALSKIEPIFNPQYRIDFNAPIFSQKIKYYKQLIDNDITSSLNSIIQDLQDSSKELILFRRKKIFEQTKRYIIISKQYIDNEGYDIKSITSPSANFSIDKEGKECAYIFNYLIVALIYHYLEFQEHFIASTDEDKRFYLDDFYLQILQCQAPDDQKIKRLETIQVSEKKEELVKIEESTKDNCYESFEYRHLAAHPDAISNLFDSLKNESKLIATDTRLVDFKRIFSGKEVNTPIKWIGTATELYYFIRSIYGINFYVKGTNKQQWNIACTCFIKENGETFDKTKLKSLKPPAEKAKKKIETAVKLLAI